MIPQKTFFNSWFLIVTNTVSCGGMLAAGNIIQQTRKKRRVPEKARDWARTVRCSMGPFMRYLYQWLDNGVGGTSIDGRYHSNSFFNLPTSMGKMEGHSLSEGLEEFKDKFWEFYKADWCVWPAAQVINFYFLPPKFRVLYVRYSQGTRNVVWGTPNKRDSQSVTHISVVIR
uniref:MPV17 mitochondrial inner membrane protein like 2 n=1 Tax=Salmo trutta TaxID=8032 RepID=A0A674EBG5_SALTR